MGKFLKKSEKFWKNRGNRGGNWLEGGNGVRFSERNYAFAVRRTKRSMCAYQNDEAENLL